MYVLRTTHHSLLTRTTQNLQLATWPLDHLTTWPLSHLLLATCHLLPTAYHLLLSTLLTTHYFRLEPLTNHLLLSTFYLLLRIPPRYSLRYSLLSTHYSLLTTHCSLLTTHYSLVLTTQALPLQASSCAARRYAASRKESELDWFILWKTCLLRASHAKACEPVDRRPSYKCETSAWSVIVVASSQ